MKYYYNGASAGADDDTLGTWAGAFTTDQPSLGASQGPSGFWPGWIAHPAFWDMPLSAATIATLGTV